MLLRTAKGAGQCMGRGRGVLTGASGWEMRVEGVGGGIGGGGGGGSVVVEEKEGSSKLLFLACQG